MRALQGTTCRIRSVFQRNGRCGARLSFGKARLRLSACRNFPRIRTQRISTARLQPHCGIENSNSAGHRKLARYRWDQIPPLFVGLHEFCNTERPPHHQQFLTLWPKRHRPVNSSRIALSKLDRNCSIAWIIARRRSSMAAGGKIAC